jgi:hypothetical protein
VRDVKPAALLRLAAACLLAAACVLAAAMAAGATAAAGAKQKPRSACQKLARSHKDLARSAKLVTTFLGDEETGRIAACVLPRGKVRTLAAWDDGLSRDWAKVVRIAGTWVLVEEGHGDQYGGVSRSLTRHDVRTGRRLSLAGYGCQLGYADRGCPSGSSFGSVVLASSGAGAYERTDLGAGTTRLEAFSPAGVFTTLADGPVERLRLAGPQILWTQAGIEHAAPLPG